MLQFSMLKITLYDLHACSANSVQRSVTLFMYLGNVVK